MEKRIENSKLGIFGGTFDPIHKGHLQCAQVAFDIFSLDEVWFIPANVSNFKQNQEYCDINDRMKMCKLALDDYGNNKFVLSSIEAQRSGISYTVDTLEEIKISNQNSDLYFITGSDAIFDLRYWYKAEKLLTLATFVSVTRKGHINPSSEQAEFLDTHLDSVKIIEADVVDISSSKLRELLKSKQEVSEYLSPKVLNYISQNNLYGN